MFRYRFGDGKVREHLGGIYDYLASKNADNINEALSLSKSQGAPAAAATKTVASESRLSYEAEKQLQKQRRKIERAVEECEEKVNNISADITALEEIMSTPEGSTQANFERYATLKKELADAESEWENSMEELEKL